MIVDCSIIIVNYNTLEITKECINSILKHNEGLSFEIILVDNASTDGSKECFENFQKIRYIYSEINLGFGRANNLGVENAKGDFVFFLNSDTLLIENSIKKLLNFFIRNEEKLRIGSLGCILVDKKMSYNGSGNEFTSCSKEIRNYRSIIPVIRYFSQNKPQQEYPLQQEFFEIGYVIGADLMMKREVFNKLGGFDPAFFMYYEESDLQYRMRKAGQKAYIYTGTKIVHLEDGSGKQIRNYNNRKRIISHTSKNIFLKKNDCENFEKYKCWDRFFIFINKFNTKYTIHERREYIKAIKKTYI